MTSATDKGPAFLIVSIVMLSITTAVFVLRIGWRAKSKQWGIDDAMLALAYTTLALHTAFGLTAYHYGFGKSKKILKPWQVSKALEYFWMLQITYKLVGGFVKLAFLTLYLRIFELPRFKFWTKVMIANVVLGTVAFTVASIAQCMPIRKAWNRFTVPGTCIDLLAFWYAHGAWHALCDIIIFIMPVPVIRTLQIPNSRKLGLVSVFALGAFTCAASVARLTTLISSARSNDPTYGSYFANLWTEIEGNTSVICACLPALRAPAVQVWRRIRGKSDKNGSIKRNYPLEYVKGPSVQRSVAEQSLDSRRWAHPDDRAWYGTAMGSKDVHGRGYYGLSQERIVGIMKTTDVQVTHRDDSPVKDKYSLDDYDDVQPSDIESAASPKPTDRF